MKKEELYEWEISDRRVNMKKWLIANGYGKGNRELDRKLINKWYEEGLPLAE